MTGKALALMDRPCAVSKSAGSSVSSHSPSPSVCSPSPEPVSEALIRIAKGYELKNGKRRRLNREDMLSIARGGCDAAGLDYPCPEDVG